MEQRRVVVTGLGLVTPVGNNVQESWSNLVAGQSGIQTITKFDAAGQPLKYGNLYSNLLDYVISAALIFYILTVLGIFRLRKTQPNAERPYRAFGYPVLPALYIVGAGVILAVLFLFKPATTLPGLAIVASGFPIYFLWRRSAATVN